MIEIGGDVASLRVDHVRAFDPRGWSILHVFEGAKKCTGALIEDNDLGPAGSGDGQWADGISFACRNGIVRRNVVTDASDSAIVIFGAPGTVVENNRIVTKKNTLLGGINLVDYGPFDGDYTGTIVRHNRIEARGGYIKVGIAAGPDVWGDHRARINRGAAISDNQLIGQHFGSGIAVQGVQDFTVVRNTASGHFEGRKAAGCHTITSEPHAAFLIGRKFSTGRFQPDFREAELEYSICMVEPTH